MTTTPEDDALPLRGTADAPAGAAVEPSVLAAYGALVAGGDVTDEAVTPRGTVRAGYAGVAAALDRLGADGLAERASTLDAVRRREGVVFTAFVDGELVEQPFPLDPVPRVVTAEDWALLSAGVEQRTRALEAFLADVYASDDGGKAEAVRAGVVPSWAVADSPGWREDGWGLTPGGQRRVAVSGLDLLRGADGTWQVLEDNLRVPSGLGYAIANRRTAVRALPELHAAARPSVVAVPDLACLQLEAVLRHAAPPRCPRDEPHVVLLSDGPANTAWYEHRLLASEAGLTVVLPSQLRERGDGGVEAVLDGGRVLPVDVVYRRFDEDELAAHPTPHGGTLSDLLVGAARAGLLTLSNALGNGVADDKALYAYVPALIRFYLGQAPVLADVPTWVLADETQWREVKDRLGELVVKPVDGYGGAGVVIGPHLTAEELAATRAEVAAAPHRFVAQEPVWFTTHPTAVDGVLVPRHVDLRVFTVAGATTAAVPAPLTRVALTEGSIVVNSSRGGGSKDTWILR